MPKRIQNSHKGTYGSVLNVAGSINYRGAAYLSSVSALKVGAGYVALAGIKEVINSVSALCPEAVFVPLKEKNGTIEKNEYKKILEILPKYKVLSFGCGLSSMFENHGEAKDFIRNLINAVKNIDIPVIIDADGLNIISKLNISKLPKNSILTPHPNELSRLLDINVSEIQNNREKYAKEAAKKYKSVVILKGFETVITDEEKTYINKTGNSALSKAGSGDVLSGMISGFCAQGVNPFDSAVLGVYLHGLTGEISSEKLTQYGVNASDLIKYIPDAIKTLCD